MNRVGKKPPVRKRHFSDCSNDLKKIYQTPPLKNYSAH